MSVAQRTNATVRCASTWSAVLRVVFETKMAVFAEFEWMTASNRPSEVLSATRALAVLSRCAVGVSLATGRFAVAHVAAVSTVSVRRDNGYAFCGVIHVETAVPFVEMALQRGDARFARVSLVCVIDEFASCGSSRLLRVRGPQVAFRREPL